MAQRIRPSLDMGQISRDLVADDTFIDKVAECISFTEEDIEGAIKPKLDRLTKAVNDTEAVTKCLSTSLGNVEQTLMTNIASVEQKLGDLGTEMEKSIAPAIASALTKEALINTLKSSVGRSVLSGAKSGDTLPLPNLEPVAKEYCAATKTSDFIRRSIKAGRHMMVSGPAGSGKTYPLHQELNAVKRRHLTVSCADGVSYGDLVVRQELRASPKGNETIWRMGLLPFSMENGIALVLDEVDQLAPELLQVLNACLESRKLLIPTTGDIITAHDDWIVGVTLNSLRDDTGVYSGFRVDERTCQRFMFISADYLPTSEEIKVVECATGVTGQPVAEVIALMTILRAAHFAGRLRGAPSTRVAIRMIRVMHGLNDSNAKCDKPLTLAEALECCYLGGMPKSQTQEAASCLYHNGQSQLAASLAKSLGVTIG